MILPTLSVRDVHTSVRFYADQLGFTHDFTLPGPDDRPAFARVSLGTVRLGLSRAAGPFDAKAVGFMLYLPDGADLDTYYAEVLGRGTPVVEPVTERFWGDRNFIVHDPDGYVLALSQHARPVDLSGLEVGMRAGKT